MQQVCNQPSENFSPMRHPTDAPLLGNPVLLHRAWHFHSSSERADHLARDHIGQLAGMMQVHRKRKRDVHQDPFDVALLTVYLLKTCWLRPSSALFR